MSDTPKTDAMMTALLWRTGETLIADVEFADFARELERENAALRDVINDIRSEINRNDCTSNLVKVDRVYCILRDLERKETKP